LPQFVSYKLDILLSYRYEKINTPKVTLLIQIFIP